jgi:hypothetical protein
MKNFGKNVNIKSKQKGLSEKDIFINVVDILDNCWTRTSVLGDEFSMDMSSYDEPFYLMIENLLYIKYGEWKTDIILWWAYNRFDENEELMPIKLNDHVEKVEEEVFIETPEELWEFLKRIDKLDKK